jgi:hypothetical protein
MSKPPNLRKNARASLYLVTTSSGYPAIWDATTCDLIIVSADEAETRKALARMVKPEKEKLPSKKGLADQLDEQLEKREGKASAPTKLEAKPKKTDKPRAYGHDWLGEPAVLVVFAGVTCIRRLYYKDGARFYLAERLAKATGMRSNSTTISRLLLQAWSRGLIAGEQWHPPKRKKRTAL